MPPRRCSPRWHPASPRTQPAATSARSSRRRPIRVSRSPVPVLARSCVCGTTGDAVNTAAGHTGDGRGARGQPPRRRRRDQRTDVSECRSAPTTSSPTTSSTSTYLPPRRPTAPGIASRTLARGRLPPKARASSTTDDLSVRRPPQPNDSRHNARMRWPPSPSHDLDRSLTSTSPLAGRQPNCLIARQPGSAFVSERALAAHG